MSEDLYCASYTTKMYQISPSGANTLGFVRHIFGLFLFARREFLPLHCAQHSPAVARSFSSLAISILMATYPDHLRPDLEHSLWRTIDHRV